ncbi:MAG TPA: S8 family serine peptidase, partial [Chloroflexota bacterium]|nr:S8 family serine peptidase [Chloroflexota bacterium]
EQVRKAATERGNWLLKEVAEHVTIGGPPSVDPAYFEERLHAIVAGWQNAHPSSVADLARFKMEDHGLFAAGIIRSIVPEAEIHLIRVLSDYGVGDLLPLVSALSRLPEQFLQDEHGRPNGKRLVVNLSLAADLPPGVSLRARSKRGDLPPSEEFLRFWFPETSRARPGEALASLLGEPRNQVVAEAVKDVHAGLQQSVDWLAAVPAGGALPEDDRRCRELLVAAAGNDRRPGSQVPAPRLPARYDDVLGVAAVNQRLAAAQYSNQGDEIDIGDGVAVFGGDASPGPNPDDPNLIELHPPSGVVDAVVGIFSAETYPQVRPPQAVPEDRTNRTGWGYWAGTSFATPVISAIAAGVWAAERGLPPRVVMDRIRGFASGPQQLGCPVIEAKQLP